MNAMKCYEVLVQENEQMLLSYLLGMTDDVALAEEAVQETFVTAWRKFGTLKKPESFGSWIRTIGRNVLLGELRKRKREVVISPAVIAGMEDVFSRLDQHVSDSAWRDRLATVRECLRALPDGLRRVCLRYYYRGEKARQVAQAMQVETTTILKRLQRAREALRTCVERSLGLEITGEVGGHV